jgi:hypothetical protein
MLAGDGLSGIVVGTSLLLVFRRLEVGRAGGRTEAEAACSLSVERSTRLRIAVLGMETAETDCFCISN